MKKTLILFGALFFHMNIAAAVTTVDHVDLTCYTGQWYEIASVPQWFQRKCAKDTMAKYSVLQSGRIEVINSCLKDNGEKSEVVGEAKVEDAKTNAKLKVSFVKIFGKYVYTLGGEYWVIDLEPNYNYAVVGHPTGQYGWILSRQPTLPDQDLIRIAENLKAQGYDTCKFNMSIQDGGNQKKLPLCDYLKTL